MPTEIDSLQISINAKAQTANRQIDALVGRLDILQKSLGKLNGGSTNLVGVANGVDRLGKAMQTMNAVKTADFTRLASNLAKLGNINVSALNSTASSLSHLTRSFSNIGSVLQNAVQVSELAKNLGKLGGKSVTNAITNIPQLATAMNKLMTTLAKSPVVSQNIIQMTNALANLSAQGGKIGRVTKSISTNLNTASSSATRAGVRFRSLAAIFGTFYANAFLFIRGIKGIYNAINSTADYLEAYNYFNVALGKIGSDWAEQYEQYGYESAEVYAESFSQRLQERIKTMSGLTIEVDAQGKGLLTASGLKNLGLNIQEVTQYASQLASVTNSVGQMGEVSLATASSLTKLGADLSSLFNINYADVMKNLQSGLIGQSRALYKYGIDITNATLQTLAYELGLTKSVSEMSQMEKMQLRLIKILRDSKVSWGDLANTINSPSNMMRQFANNAKELGIVFGQLFIPLLQKIMPILNGVTIALKNLLVTIATLLGINLNLDDFGQGFSDLGEDVEDVADGFDGASNAIKKFKGQLLGIDELNVLNSGDNASGGGGIAMNTIDLTEQIIKATEEYEKAWDEAYRRMQNKAQQIADKIDEILAPIKGVFANLFNGQYYAAGYGFGNIFKSIFDWLTDQVSKVDWQGVGRNIGNFMAGIKWSEIFTSGVNLISEIMQSALDTWQGFKDTAPLEAKLIQLATLVSVTGFGKTLMTRLAGSLSATGIGFVPTVVIASVVWDITFDVGKSLGKALFPNDKIFYDTFKLFGADGFFETVLSDFGRTLVSIYDMTNDFAKKHPVLLTLLIGENAQVFFIVPEKIRDLGSVALHAFYQSGFSGFKDALQQPIIDAFNDTFFAKEVLPWFSEQKWADLWNNVKTAFSQKWQEIVDWWNDSAVGEWFNKSVIPWFSEEKWTTMLSSIPTAFKSVFKKAANGAIGFLNDIIKGIETMINGALESLSSLEFLSKIGIDLGSFDKVSLPRIPAYRNGGFPEDGLFYANREELVGRFSNGKTAVANNEMIVSGIEGGVERAVSRVLAPYLADIADSSRRTANKEFGITRRQAFNAVREEAMIFRKSTGAPAF